MRNRRLIILLSVLGSLTLLIILASVVFSVQTVDAYCYNVEQSTLMQQVLDSHGVKKGGSIFLADKNEIKDAVEKKVPGVRVVNVEKRFPNRITINYAEVREYLAVVQNGQTYVCSNQGKVLRIVGGVDEADNYIKLTLGSQLTSVEVGDSLAATNAQDIAIANATVSALERMGYYDTVIDLIDGIDLTAKSYITFNISSGMKWKVFGAENLLGKLRLALSVYQSSLSDDQKKTGTLTVTEGDEIKAQYNPN